MNIDSVISILAGCLYHVKTRHLSTRRAFAYTCKELSCKGNMFDREQLFNLTREFISSYYHLKCLFEKRGKHSPGNKTLARLFLYLYFEKINEKPSRKLGKLVCRDLTGEPPIIGETELSCYYSLPRWFVEKLASLTPDLELVRLLNALNRKITWIRINTLKMDLDKALRALEDNGVEYIDHKSIPFLVRVIKSETPIRTTRLFKEGVIIPQDKASVLVILALEPEPYMTVYDFAAAPGIKASLIMQLTENKARVIAVDNSPRRLERMKILLKRLGVDISRIKLIYGDSRELVLREKGDIALVDAPCSSSGAMSKDPAIKLFLEKENVVYDMKRLQVSMLNNALRHVDKAVYSTCSLLPEEGEEVVLEILEKSNDHRLITPSIEASSGYNLYPIWSMVKRTFPHIDESEGFFIARFER